MKKSGCMLLVVLLMLTACSEAYSEGVISGESDTEKTESSFILQDEMMYFDREENREVLSEDTISKISGEVAYYYKVEDLEVVLYQETDSQGYALNNIYVLLNGQKLFCEFLNGYLLRDWIAPNICLYDVNGDGMQDVSLYGYLDRVSMVHCFYISTEDGTYRSLGSVVWDNESSYSRFPYEVSLLDGQKVHVELEEFGIDAIADIDEDTMKYAYIPLEIYEENGTLTDYGKSWVDYKPDSWKPPANGFWAQPWAEEISYSADENDRFVICVKYALPAGYSSWTLGCGFIFDWTIEEGEYHLLDVLFFEE